MVQGQGPFPACEGTYSMTERLQPMLVLLLLCCSREVTAQKAYTSYEDFNAWRALVPELREARSCNLTVAGHDLWAHGQLRLPAETFLRGDLRHTGSEEWAVPFADGDDAAPCSYVLVTTRHPEGWQRLLLQRVLLEDSASGFALVWNEREQAIGIDFGKRRRVTSPATLVWQDGWVLEAKAGYVIDLVLVSQIIGWVQARRRFEYRRSATPEEWDVDHR